MRQVVALRLVITVLLETERDAQVIDGWRIKASKLQRRTIYVDQILKILTLWRKPGEGTKVGQGQTCRHR